MFCPNCGKKSDESALFCPHCGASFQTNDAGKKISSEKIMYFCPRCKAVFKGEQGNKPTCGSCQLKTMELGFGEAEWYEKNVKEREALVAEAAERAKTQIATQERNLYGIKITTGHYLEGYKIVEYLDICTGNCVLGTGFLSNISANWADFFGTTSGQYESKLKQAKGMAMRSLKEEAHALGANAIVGVDIDYTTFGGDIMGVIASGTAVVIEPKE